MTIFVIVVDKQIDSCTRVTLRVDVLLLIMIIIRFDDNNDNNKK